MSHLDVFISYARSGSLNEARGLRDALAAKGISAFLDERSIEAGAPFPAEIADALLGARVFVLVADETYFTRPWCVYELQAAVAPFRAHGGVLDHVVVALGDLADPNAVIPHLPPPLASISWPRLSETNDLIGLIGLRLASVAIEMGRRLEGLDDEVIRTIRQGGTVPVPAVPARLRGYLRGLPATLKSSFVGRDGQLWLVHHELVTRSAEGGQSSCLIVGGAGTGKSQLAAEYVWRFGSGSFSGGLVWIDADLEPGALVAELHGVLTELDPGTSPLGDLGSDEKAQRREIERRLDAAVAALPDGRRVLWVVDNLPESSADGAPVPLTDFCPVWRRVSLLATTRRTGTRGLDAVVALGELDVDPAVVLLTQPPVDKRALEDGGWREIARWVGCLPLALKPLHDSLADGYLAPAELLAKARSTEPAAAVDAEVDALRDEIASPFLRGISEALDISYRNLSRQPLLQQTAHTISWLSPVPVPDGPLRRLGGGRVPAQLAARGWLQQAAASGDMGAVGWRMHRVYASFLRARSRDQDAELARVADWLHECYSSELPASEVGALRPHLYVGLGNLAAWCAERSGTQARESAERLALWMATHRLSDRAWRGRRYLAAGLAVALGIADRLVDALATAYRGGGDDVAVNVAGMLHGLAGSDGAARLATEVLRDPRDAVRWQVLIHGHLLRRPDIVTRPLLQALMTEPNDNLRRNAALGFEDLLAPDVPETRAALSDLARYASEGNREQRMLAVSILGQLLRHYGPSYAAGGFSYGHLLRGLAHLAVEDSDDEVAAIAARELGWLDDEAGRAVLVHVVETATDWDTRWRAIDLLGAYAQAAEAPEAPIATWHVEDGTPSLLVNFGASQKTRPELTAPLFAIAANPAGDLALQERALCAALRSRSGKLALIQCFERAMGEGRYADVVEFADLALRVDPELPTGRWWRAQAREALRDLDGARVDFESLVDDRSDTGRLYHALAWSGLGRIHTAAGRHAAALACHEKALALDSSQPAALLDYAYALEMAGYDEQARTAYRDYLTQMPNDVYGHRALARLLIQGDQLDEALTHLDQLLALAPNDIEARYQRGYLHYTQGDFEQALTDLRAVTRAWPDRISALHLMAGCLLQAGRHKEAVEVETKAIALDPACGECWLILAHALYGLGETREALHAAEKASSLDPQDVRAANLRDHLASVEG